jgi:hypothetical protein
LMMAMPMLAPRAARTASRLPDRFFFLAGLAACSSGRSMAVAARAPSRGWS